MKFRGWFCHLALAWLLVATVACGSSNTEDGNRGPGLGATQGDAYNLDLSLELGRLCLQSYQMLDDFNAGTTFTLPAPYTLVKTFSTSEPFASETLGANSVPIAFIATQGDTIYLVFRGTVTISEWIDDAQLSQVLYPFLDQGGQTEQGFTKVYQSIEPDILATIQGLSQQGGFTKLLVTGHSLGGALAGLAAPDLVHQTSFSNLVMYSFAGPRVGDPKFAEDTYGNNVKTSWRVVNTNDLVPKLPEATTVVFINNQPKVFFYEHFNQEQDLTFGNPISGPTDVTDIAFDHEMCNYYNALCAQTSDPTACRQANGGAHGCDP